MELKNALITTASILGIVVFVILIGFSVYNLYNSLAVSWGYSSGCGIGGCPGADTPYVSGACNQFKDNYELSISISNGKKEMKGIRCELVSKGGMTSDKDDSSLSFISPNSSDLCIFALKGESTGSVTARISYSLKGFWGDKKFSSIVTPYPACGETIDIYGTQEKVAPPK
ncbi:MAG: hypothetical protein AAB509_02380 [Patescibacteria group bacterium]